FRAEGVTAEQCCGIVRAPADLRELWLLHGARGALTVCKDLHTGWKAMQERNAYRLFSVAVL
ncbi:MAG: hypothetical protein ABI608_05155, partial [Rhizomicrobium sp.]